MSKIEKQSDPISGFFGRLARGDYGLAKTYWIFGVVVGIATQILAEIASNFGLGALYFVVFINLLYLIPLTLGIWRATNLYKGKKIWAILAKIAISLGIISVIVSMYALIRILFFL